MQPIMAGTPFDPEAEEAEAAVLFWQYVCSSEPCTECHDPQPKFVTRFGLNRHVKVVDNIHRPAYCSAR